MASLKKVSHITKYWEEEMKRGIFFHSALVFALLITSLLNFAPFIQNVKAQSDFVDSFDTSTLRSEWSKIDTAGGSTFDLSANPGWLRITSPSDRDLLPVKFDAPRLSQSASGDFTVETKVSATTDENDEGAGILIWKDRNNYVRLERMSRTIGRPVQQQILFGGSVAGVWPCPGDKQVVLSSNLNPTCLKLVRSNNILTGWYSSDGTNWSQAGTIPFAVADPVNIGLAVVNMYHSGSFYADFDYFKINYATTTATGGLLASWKFDEGSGNTVSDSSGNNYQGTIHGASWSSKRSGSALKFNGVSDYVSIPSLPITNADSLTVVAWINSDFSKIGYIFYHGDTGEFLLHNGERTRDGPVAGRYPNIASFSVKLSGSTWYDVYSSILTPNTWHQIVGVWTKGSSLKIYVDGALSGENNAISSGYLLNVGPYWLPSLGVYNRGAEADTYFKGMLDEVMVYNRALSAQEINALYNDAPAVTRSNLEVSCKSSTSYSGFKVEIKGSLAINGTAISSAPILLSYSVNGGKSWADLTLVNTGSDGSYSAVWMPSVTGNYLIKATYEGNDDYSGTTEVVSLAVTQYSQKNVFSVSSNSTVSSLAFNSTSRELSFTVTGESGTFGYADVYVAKTLVQDAAGIKVYIDGNKMDCTASSTEDSWLLHFTYHHSTRLVTVSLGASSLFGGDLFGNWLVYGAIIAVIIIIAVAVLMTRRKR